MTKKQILNYIKGLKSVPFTYNKYQWGESNIITDLDLFNTLAQFAFSYGRINLTPRGHLSVRGLNSGGAVWSEKNSESRSSVEFLFLHNANVYSIVFRPATEQDVDFSGLDALNVLREECKKELKPFAIRKNEDVAAIKATIPKYNITLTPIGEMLKDAELDNCFHIDINSAFPAGVVANYPQFRPFFEYHYRKRKNDGIHKAIMNYAIGAAQSLKIRGNRYPELARAGIQWTNDKLKELTNKIEKKKYVVIGYNTDGIFVMKTNPKQPLYTDNEEGTELGQWKVSHVFDKLRFKSAGSYEYIENGKYTPVVRGATVLDRTKDRSEWKWGDIYQAIEVRYMLNLEKNILEEVRNG